MIAVKGYEGIYVVSQEGEVFSLDRKVQGVDGNFYCKKGKKLVPAINSKNGYKQVSLWKNNKGKSFYIHRLVAEAFIPNPECKLEINHKDSDRLNCSVRNLEWSTSQENSIHAYEYGFATQKPRRKLTEGDYKEIFKRFMAGESFSSVLTDFDIGPARLSTNLKHLTKKWSKYEEYRAEIYRQQVERAKKNGTN